MIHDCWNFLYRAAFKRMSGFDRGENESWFVRNYDPQIVDETNDSFVFLCKDGKRFKVTITLE